MVDSTTITRIAVIQHGDYREASRLVSSGQPVPYAGMRYSVQCLQRLLAGHPHIVISLDAPIYCDELPQGFWIGLPRPHVRLPLKLSLLAEFWHARRVLRELRSFRPTHVLLRIGNGLLMWLVLRYCANRNISVLHLLANQVKAETRMQRVVLRRIVRLLNAPHVFLVGNHRWPAAESTVAAGVRADKVVAYDWEMDRRPEMYPTKSHAVGSCCRLVYVGALALDKGIGDLIDACAILVAEGRPIVLDVAGDGLDRAMLCQRAEHSLAGRAVFHGRVGNDRAFDLMLKSTIVCVPSRHGYSEGMPLTLTEGLTSRTPVVASDHPMIVAAFRDGEGVRLFEAGNPRSLANAIAALLDCPEGYRHLSESTLDAYQRVVCKTMMGELFDRWAASTMTASLARPERASR